MIGRSDQRLGERFLADELRGRRLHWFGALSFEERCLGSLEALASRRESLGEVVALEYETAVTHRSEDRRRRREHRARLEAAATARYGKFRSVMVLPYDPMSISGALFELAESDDDLVVVDITCMTRAHVLGLAALTVQNAALAQRLLFAYSTPSLYNASGTGSGWQETRVIPIIPGARLGNSATARGIALLGHEGDRLAVALSEFEPTGGMYVVAHSFGRPEFSRLTRRENRNMIEYWGILSPSGWQPVKCSVETPTDLVPYLKAEVERAKAMTGPAVLFPYGPKLLCLVAARLLAEAYPERSWFVYPIPLTYDVNHSIGIGSTSWMNSNYEMITG